MALRKGDKERKKKLTLLSNSRPLGPGLKRSLTDSRGIVPGSLITLPVTTDHTLIGQEAIDGQKIIDKYDLATRGGKKSRKKRRRKKKKSRKKKKKTRRRKKKAGFLLEGALGYYLYQTQMNGKKAVFNLPVQYVDPPQPDAELTPQPTKGGKRTRKRKGKRKGKKRRKTRKRRGGADSLRDGIKQIYKGKKASTFSTPTGPGSWGRQLSDLYDSYQEHLHALSMGQKVARKFKNLFRNSQTKKPLTEGEADRIFLAEAITMKALLKDMLLRKKSSIQEIYDNPDAMIYSERDRDSDPEKQRLSTLIEEEIPRLSEEVGELEYSIIRLDGLIGYIKRSSSNSIPRHGSSIETNLGSMDPLPYVNPQRYRGLDSTLPKNTTRKKSPTGQPKMQVSKEQERYNWFRDQLKKPSPEVPE